MTLALRPLSMAVSPASIPKRFPKREYPRFLATLSHLDQSAGRKQHVYRPLSCRQYVSAASVREEQDSVDVPPTLSFRKIPSNNFPGYLGGLIVGLFLSSSICYADDEALSWEELKKLASELGVELPAGATEEHYLSLKQACFERVLRALQKGQWEKLSPLYARLTDRRGQSLLCAAVERADEVTARELLKRKIALKVTDQNGNNPLHIAARCGFGNFIGFLSDHFDINALNKLEETPLHVAMIYGHAHCVEGLVKEGASFTKKKRVFTPIALAVLHGQIPCLDILIKIAPETRSQLTQPISEKGTVLHLALQSPEPNMFEHLIRKYHADTEVLLTREDDLGRAPLHLAAYLGNLSAIRNLYDLNPRNLHVRNSQEETAVHWAAKGEQPDAIRRLDYYEVDLRAVDQNEKTALSLLKDKIEISDDAQQCMALLTKLPSIAKRDKRNPPDFSKQLPKNLIFKGGGPKGIAFVGALEQLEKLDALTEVTHVAGTSAGAITAALVAVGLNSKQLLEHLDKDFTELMDPKENLENWLLSAATSSNGWKAAAYTAGGILKEVASLENPLTKATRLYRRFSDLQGLCEGEELRKWIEELIAKATGIQHCTFGDLRKLAIKDKRFKQLCMYAVQLHKESPSDVLRLSSDDPQWEHLVISDAVRASVTIPGIFKPHTLHFIDPQDPTRTRMPHQKYTELVDGGMVKNFPLDAYDRNERQGKEEWGASTNRRTLGFCLTTVKKEKPVAPGFSSLDLVKSLITTYYEVEASMLEADLEARDRFVDIPIEGVGLLDFGLSSSQKEKLIEAGKKAVEVQFASKKKDLISDPSKARLYNFKIADEYFVGRSRDLQALRQAFIPPGWNRQATVGVKLIWGLEGLGKTDLITKFANTHLEEFSIIWTLNYGDGESLRTQYQELARQLKIPIENGLPFESLRNQVNYRLENDAWEKPWLLIYDDASQELTASDLPKRGGFVAITAKKNTVWKNRSDHIPLKPLSEEEAVSLLKQIAPEQASKEAHDYMIRLIQDLGGNPFLLKQAACYIAQVETSFKRYLLDLERGSGNHKSSLQKIYARTLEELSVEHPHALQWLKRCAFLSTDNIPFTWLEDWVKKQGSPEGVSADRILSTLASFGLLKYDKHEEVFSLHPLMQEAIRDELSEQETRELVHDTINFFRSRSSMNLITKQALLENQYFIPHIDTLATYSLGDRFPLPDIVELLCNAGNYFLQSDRLLDADGRFKKVLQYCGDDPKQDAHTACDRLRKKGKRLPAFYGKALHYMGIIQFRLGNLETADTLIKRSIEVRTEIERSKHHYEDPEPLDTIIFERQGKGWLLLESNQLDRLQEAVNLYETLKKKRPDDPINQRYCNLQLVKAHHKMARLSEGDMEKEHYEKAQKHLALISSILKELDSVARKGEYYLVQARFYIDPQAPDYNLKEAEAALNRVISSSSSTKSQLAEAHYLLAEVCLQAYQQKKSLDALKKGAESVQKSLQLYHEVQSQYDAPLPPLKISIARAEKLQKKLESSAGNWCTIS